MTGEEVTRVKYDYSYPNKMSLKPGSDLHEHILNSMLQRANAGYGHLSKQFGKWQDVDMVMKVYMPADKTDKTGKREKSSEPVPIIYPYSLAIKETILAHLTKTLLVSPVIRYEGVGPEDVLGAMLLEKVVNHHIDRNKCILNLHTLLDDDLKYGFGAIAPTWNDGNALCNISPYHTLTDPNIPITNLQKAEFFGWCELGNYYSILRNEQSNYQYFNGKYVQHTNCAVVSYYNLAAIDNFVVYGDATGRPCVLLKMYMWIIPKEWKLGDNEYPELWYFELVNSAVVITAQRANLDCYPVVIGSTNFDGYTSFTPSKMESMLGMQRTLDWLINSHMKAVQQGVNNRFVVDPSLINMTDLHNGAPYIRTRKLHWGRGVTDGLKQLQIYDVTANHIGDSNYMVQAMQKLAGADEASMGSLRDKGPERLTSAEFSGTREGLQARLNRMVMVLGVQVIQELGKQFAFNTQAYMEDAAWVSLTGNYQNFLQKLFGGATHLRISPSDINVNIDVKAVPAYYGERSAGTLLELLKLLSGSQELSSRFDITKIVKYILSSAGVTNVDAFERANVQVASDEAIQKGVQDGNYVPVPDTNPTAGGSVETV